MFRAAEKISDLIFSPGRPPQVQVYGQMIPVQVSGFTVLTADDTRHIAADLIGDNKQAITTLREHGACDISYGLPGLARFRVNIFIQRGSCAVVMRVIPTRNPGIRYHCACPTQLIRHHEAAGWHRAGDRTGGSGKSSTLGGATGCNQSREKLSHHHDRRSHRVPAQPQVLDDSPAGIAQRHTQLCPCIAIGHAAGPKVILVGEMRDRETIEIVLEAAETGHLVLSSLNTMDASKTVRTHRGLVSAPASRRSVRERFAKSFRYIICQRLMPKTDRSGRVAAFEIVKANARSRECIEKGERDNRTLLDAIKAGSAEGMQHFDGDIARIGEESGR